MGEWLTAIDGAVLADVTIRAAGYICALIAAGAVAVVALADRHGVSTRPMRRLAAGTAIAGIVLVALGVTRRAAFLGGGTFTAAVDPALLTLVMESPFGAAAVVRASGLLAASALILGRRHGDAVAWAGSAAIIASFALSGHVLGEPRWALAALVIVHTAAVAYWLGALPGLWLVTRVATTGQAAGIVEGFGKRAQWVVAALVVAGSGLLILLAGSAGALVRSAWGLAIGAQSRRRHGAPHIAAHHCRRVRACGGHPHADGGADHHFAPHSLIRHRTGYAPGSVRLAGIPLMAFRGIFSRHRSVGLEARPTGPIQPGSAGPAQPGWQSELRAGASGLEVRPAGPVQPDLDARPACSFQAPWPRSGSSSR